MPTYILKDKEGKEIARGEGKDHLDAALKAGVEVYHAFEIVDPVPPIAKSRKPRADKGVPHKPQEEKAKRAGRYWKYFLYQDNASTNSGTLSHAMTKDEVEKAAIDLPPMVRTRVIYGLEKKLVIQTRIENMP